MDDEGIRFYKAWEAIRESGKALSGTERGVLLAMLSFVNFRRDLEIWPKDVTIAWRSGFSERTVKSSRKKFKAMGLIHWTRNPNGPNTTSIDLDAIFALADRPNDDENEGE